MADDDEALFCRSLSKGGSQQSYLRSSDEVLCPTRASGILPILLVMPDELAARHHNATRGVIFVRIDACPDGTVLFQDVEFGGFFDILAHPPLLEFCFPPVMIVVLQLAPRNHEMRMGKATAIVNL